jgi:CheY-like chemotaxis protein
MVLRCEVGERTLFRMWPRGVMGRRGPLETLARTLCEQSNWPGEVVVSSLARDARFRGLPEVRDEGPLAFALIPLPSPGPRGLIAALREEGPWTQTDVALLRDLASAFAGEAERMRLEERAVAIDASVARVTEEHARNAQVWVTGPMSALEPVLSSICHELNNPLTSIKSFAELMLMDRRSTDDREALEIVQREAHRAATIISDLRRMARQGPKPEGSRARPVREQVADTACAAAGLRSLPPVKEQTVKPGVAAVDQPPASQPLRLLVVDDEAPIRFSLARYMERRGHTVDQASDGAAALRLLEERGGCGAYDIIVADLRMPGLDGEALLACIRERRDGLEQRLIFMTGEQCTGTHPLLHDSGVPVMCKPFELAEVAQVIEAQARLQGG